jgi:hypothetical protein
MCPGKKKWFPKISNYAKKKSKKSPFDAAPQN